MEFFIKKNATLPALKLQVLKSGRSDFQTLMNGLINSTILFSMTDVQTGVSKIASSPVEVLSYIPYDGDDTEYYLNYQFSKRNTSKPGRYKGEFLIQNSQGNTVLPLKDELYINITDSIIPIDACCPDSNNTNNNLIDLVLDVNVIPGSINLEYSLVSSEPVPNRIRLDFTNTFDVYSGSSIIVTTGITINQGGKSGTTSVYIPDGNINNLTRNYTFTNTSINPPQLFNLFNKTETAKFPTPTNTQTPTVTPTNTQTPTVTPTNTTTQTVTPSVTQGLTPTATPTNTRTPNSTPTKTVTNTPTKTPTQTNTPTLTQTTTPTNINPNKYTN